MSNRRESPAPNNVLVTCSNFKRCGLFVVLKDVELSFASK